VFLRQWEEQLLLKVEVIEAGVFKLERNGINRGNYGINFSSSVHCMSAMFVKT